MADVYRQMQKTMCGGDGTYGCPCCRWGKNLRWFKKTSRKIASAKLKRLPDEFIGTRR